MKKQNPFLSIAQNPIALHNFTNHIKLQRHSTRPTIVKDLILLALLLPVKFLLTKVLRPLVVAIFHLVQKSGLLAIKVVSKLGVTIAVAFRRNMVEVLILRRRLLINLRRYRRGSSKLLLAL